MWSSPRFQLLDRVRIGSEDQGADVYQHRGLQQRRLPPWTVGLGPAGFPGDWDCCHRPFAPGHARPSRRPGRAAGGLHLDHRRSTAGFGPRPRPGCAASCSGVVVSHPTYRPGAVARPTFGAFPRPRRGCPASHHEDHQDILVWSMIPAGAESSRMPDAFSDDLTTVPCFNPTCVRLSSLDQKGTHPPRPTQCPHSSLTALQSESAIVC